MCVYCNTGDTFFRHDPPWKLPQDFPYVPQPANPLAPMHPWPLEKLKDYYDLLKSIKALEDQVGCPCEPNKADYLKMFEDRIAELEKKQKRVLVKTPAKKITVKKQTHRVFVKRHDR